MWGFESPSRHHTAGYCKPAETNADKLFQQLSVSSSQSGNGSEWSNLAAAWPRFMIDWVTRHSPLPSLRDNGGRIASISPDGEIEWQVEKKQQVSGSHESNISIKSNGASHLYFDGNPSKWLQGHNLFGSNNLILQQRVYDPISLQIKCASSGLIKSIESDPEVSPRITLLASRD